MVQVQPGVAGSPPVRLTGRDRRFGTDRAVWAAMARDPSLVVSSLGAPGQKITHQGQDGPVTFTIVGSQSPGLLPGVFGTERALGAFRAAPLGATVLLDIQNPAEAGTVAGPSSGPCSRRGWTPRRSRRCSTRHTGPTSRSFPSSTW